MNHSQAKLIRRSYAKRTRFNRSALATTVNDDNAIAPPANIGDISSPITG